MSRSSGLTESGPGRPPPGEARRAAQGAQAVRIPWRGARQCQFPHVSSPTGPQAVSAHALCAIRVSIGSVPGVARRPSVPHACAVSCPASRALFDAGGQVCSDIPPSRLGPVHSNVRVSIVPPFQLDVAPLAVAGSRPATDRSAQGTFPHLIKPFWHLQDRK
jgi:hypothetical protein